MGSHRPFLGFLIALAVVLGAPASAPAQQQGKEKSRTSRVESAKHAVRDAARKASQSRPARRLREASRRAKGSAPAKRLRRVAGAIRLRRERESDKNLDWLRDADRPIAHRGYFGAGRPENSMSAFRAAVEKGLPFELDVHLLKDGKAVVFHDATLERMTGETGRISELTSRELNDLRLEGSNGESPPLLEDVLEMVDGRVPVLIELKGSESYKAAGPLERAVAKNLEGYQGPAAVWSFSPWRLRWFHKNAPEVPRGQLSGSFKDDTIRPLHTKALLKRLWFNPVSRPDFIGYGAEDLPTRAVTRAREQGKPVVGATIQNAREAAEAAPNVDNILFDPPL